MDLPRDLFKIKVPTLVIWGELDQALLVGNLEGLEQYVDDLTIKRIPDATHWIVNEQPELVNSLIREFLA
jgi:pimeloyl-ACP methyl ester carboxylesterase